MSEEMNNIRRKAAARGRHIVLAEGDDPRVRRAAAYLSQNELCSVTLLRAGGEEEAPKGVPVIDIGQPTPRGKSYADRLWEQHGPKLESREKTRALMRQAPYYAAAMVRAGHADGAVAGAVATTADVLRAAIRVIGLKQGSSVVSSTFLMALAGGRTVTYADCGVVPYPDAAQLADIAADAAGTHQRLTGQVPRVAMLSFSTKGSAVHPRSELVVDALKRVQRQHPELAVDGELQFDAAFVPEVATRKAPGSSVAGSANVFIFPNLDAGNIAYKITERLAGATATGPILQGLARPMMDLSRGCSWNDIVNAACVAVLMGA